MLVINTQLGVTDMNPKMFFKWLKQNNWDIFYTLEVTGEGTDMIFQLLKYYPFLKETIMDQINMEDNIFYLGNDIERQCIDTAIKQKRLIYLSGGRGTGKSYYLSKFRDTHDIVYVNPEKERFSNLYPMVAYESLAGRPKLVIIDSIEKITQKLALELKQLAESCRVGCVIVTRLAPKMLMYSERVKVGKKYKTVRKELPGEKIVFREVSTERKTNILIHLFPVATEEIATKYAKSYPLHKCIQLFKYGSTTPEPDRFLRTKDIVGNLLMNNDRMKVLDILLRQKPNPSTLAIYLADQNLTEHNRDVVTDFVSRHIYNIDIRFVYAELVFGLETQRTVIVTPDTITRRKWKFEEETVKTSTKRPAKKLTKKLTKKNLPKIGGLDSWKIK